jgi:hypothetical protein
LLLAAQSESQDTVVCCGVGGSCQLDNVRLKLEVEFRMIVAKTLVLKRKGSSKAKSTQKRLFGLEKPE